MARPFLAVPDTVTVPLKAPQEESRRWRKREGAAGKLPGSLCAVTALPHPQKISFQLPPSPTYRHLYVRGFLWTPRRGTPVQRYLAPREVGQDLGRAAPHHHLWDLVTLRGRWSSFSPPTRQTSIIFVLLVLRWGTRNPCPRAPSSEICPSQKTMLQKPSMTFRVSHRAALESNSSF